MLSHRNSKNIFGNKFFDLKLSSLYERTGPIRLAPFINTGFALPSWVGEIRHDEYCELRNLCANLLSFYSLRDTYFLGIGRSPTPIIGFLQEQESVSAKNIPLSCFRHRPSGRAIEIPDGKKKDRYRSLCPKMQAALYQHFDRFFLFDQDIFSRKQWVLLDFSQTGDTLASVHDYLNLYLRHRHPRTKPRLEILCLADPKSDESRISATLSGRSFRIFQVKHYPCLCSGFCLQRYDLASEYGSFFIERGNSEDLFRNESYDRLRRSIRNEQEWEILERRLKLCEVA